MKRFLFAITCLFITNTSFAQWSSTYIGGAYPDLATSFDLTDGLLSIEGTGQDWWNQADDGYFVHQKICGDVVLTTKLESQEQTHEWAKAGLMIRNTLAPESIAAILMTTEAGGLLFQARNSDGSPMAHIIGNGSIKDVVWLRIEKRGNTITSSYAADGTNWITLGVTDLVLDDQFYIGFGVTSIVEELSSVEFSNIDVQVTVSEEEVYSVTEAELVERPEEYSTENSIETSENAFVSVAGNSQTTEPNEGLSYDFAICKEGTYNLWGRFKNTGKVWTKIDDGNWFQWDVNTNDNWQWVRLNDRSNPLSISVSGGNTSVEVAYYSALNLDVLMLTDDLDFVPEGFGFSPLLTGPLYVSNDGDDANSGASESEPIQSIQEANRRAQGAKQGASILLRSGDTFRGSIELPTSGVANNKISIGSYGDNENKPVLSGAVVVNNWELYQGNIYKATLNHDHVQMLFVDGDLLTLARYPNNEQMLFTSAVSDINGLISSDLTQPDGYWNGANVRMRTRNWTWEHRKVGNYIKGEVTYNLPSVYEMINDQGFYFDNKFEELDQAGEWYFDANNKELYVWLPSDSNPNDHTIEAAVFNTGIELVNGQSHIVFENIAFTKYAENGIEMLGASSNNEIKNCEFSKIWEAGIEYFGDDIIVRDNYLHNMISISIAGYNCERSKVSNNIIENTAQVNALGLSGPGFHNNTGIFLLNASHDSITNNTLSNIGGMGISYYGDNGYIAYNQLEDILTRIDDGGGLYAWGDNSRRTTWEKNIVKRVVGSRQGAYGVSEHLPGTIAIGIYMDNLTNENYIKNNTIVECQNVGMLSNTGSRKNEFIGNVTYKNRQEGLLFVDFDPGVEDMLVKDNFFYSVNSIIPPFRFISNVVDVDKATFENNSYFSPRIEGEIVTIGANLETWEAITGEDVKLSFFILEDGDEDPSELFINPSMENLEVNLESEYVDEAGEAIAQFTLAPFKSRVLFQKVEFINRFITTSSVDIDEQLEIKIYPNPSSDFIYFSKALRSVNVYSSSGKLLFKQENNVDRISIQALPKGMYIISVKDQDKNYVTKIFKN